MATSRRSSRRRAGRAQLLRDSWFTAELEAALAQVFKRFDTDGDGLLSISELQAYSRAVNNGEELGADEIEQVNDYFETKGGHLTHAGFQQMYYMQTDSRPEDTVRDLERLGYSPQTLRLAVELQPEPEPEPEPEAAAPLTAAEKKRLQNARKRQKQKAKQKAAAASDVGSRTEQEPIDHADSRDSAAVVTTANGKTLRLGAPPPQPTNPSNPALLAAVAAAEAADAEEFGSGAKPAHTTAGAVLIRTHRFLFLSLRHHTAGLLLSMSV